MFKKIIYPAVFSQADDGITITFPNLPGCISCVDTFKEAYEMAREAMELFLEDYIKEMFKNAPKSSNLKTISLKENDCIALIELNVQP